MKCLLTFLIIGCVLFRPVAAEEKSAQAKRVDELVRQLKDNDLGARCQAAVAIGEMGKKAKNAIPALLEVMLNAGENFNVHNHAVAALQKMGLDAQPALIESLEKGSDFVRRVSARGLGDMGGGAVPALIKALKDPDRTVRLRAVQSLGKIGPPAKAAASALQRAASERNYSIVKSAHRALWLIQPRAMAKPPSFPHGAVDRGLSAFLHCAQTSFEVGEPIPLNHGLLFVGEAGQSVTVWRPSPAVDPNNGSWLEVTGPDGQKVGYRGPYISFGALRPSAKNTAVLYQGEFVGRVHTDLSDAFDLIRPGTYIVRWGCAMSGSGLWSGKLFSNSVKFKVVARRPLKQQE